MSVNCWLFVDFHGSAAFSILPIDIENPSRLLKRTTLSIITICLHLEIENVVSHSNCASRRFCREEWAIIGKVRIRCFNNNFWTAMGYSWQLTLLWWFYANKMSIIYHCYALVSCYNRTFCRAVSRNFGVLKSRVKTQGIDSCIPPSCPICPLSSRDSRHRKALPWFTKLSVWSSEVNNSIEISIIDRNVHR